MRCTLVSSMDRFHLRAERTGTHLFIGNLTTSQWVPNPFRSLFEELNKRRRSTSRLSSGSSCSFFCLYLVSLSRYWSTKKAN